MHGNRTKESMATYSNKVAELDYLEAIAHSVGIMEGSKWAGRNRRSSNVTLWLFIASYSNVCIYE